MDLTRRGTLLGVGGTLTAGAAAPTIPRIVTRHPGFKAWTVMYDPDPLPLELKVTTSAGEEAPLWAWLGHGPTVLVVWAKWCSPCLSEKSAQAFLQRRLTYLKASTKIKLLQAFDPTPMDAARATLDRLGAKELESAKASPEMEKALVGLFGPAPSDPKRTSVPVEVLIGPGGVELGRARGTMHSPSGQSYWGDAVTMQFLAGLDRMLLEA